MAEHGLDVVVFLAAAAASFAHVFTTRRLVPIPVRAVRRQRV